MNAQLLALTPPRAWFPTLLAIIILLTLYRWLALDAADLQLYFDEAYYWGWSRDLAFGYYSKPPMIAWTIRAATEICGDTAFCIHTPPLLLFSLTALIIHIIGSRLFSAPVGFVSALIFATLPLVSFYSWLMTTDALLLFFWALGFWGFIGAVENNAWRNWLLMGTALGLGLLSKYTAALFLVSAIITMIAIPRYRQHLTNPRAGLALLWALLIFSPNLVWNSSMQFASFKHTAEIAKWHENLFHPNHLLEFIGVQLLLFGPVLSLMILGFGIRMRKSLWADERIRLILGFTLPILILYSAQALVAKANYNWAAASYVAASILAGGMLMQAQKYRWIIIALLINATTGSLIYHYGDIMESMGIPLSKKTDIYISMKGWRELGTQVQTFRNQYPEAGFISDNRRLLAELNYYLSPRPTDSVIWNPVGKMTDHYRLTADLNQSSQSSFIFVSAETSRELLRKSFKTVTELGRVTVQVHKDYSLEHPVFYVKDFLGYPAG